MWLSCVCVPYPELPSVSETVLAGFAHKPDESFSLYFLGEKRFSYEKNETQTVFYHEDGHPALLVGGKDKLYYFDFENSGNYTVSRLHSNT